MYTDGADSWTRSNRQGRQERQVPERTSSEHADNADTKAYRCLTPSAYRHSLPTQRSSFNTHYYSHRSSHRAFQCCPESCFTGTPDCVREGVKQAVLKCVRHRVATSWRESAAQSSQQSSFHCPIRTSPQSSIHSQPQTWTSPSTSTCPGGMGGVFVQGEDRGLRIEELGHF